ncbi:hypothetical protein CEXT_436061 [Caerostris extrusa]|uniref:Uncharacterized protein n=1 Tax=Caerostris extrusa TaxID=172846 RepID=A0AAV4MKH0_CAEEX|nr:hypothetical protein CEXT_436061 [Caerostris extrusa]
MGPSDVGGIPYRKDQARLINKGIERQIWDGELGLSQFLKLELKKVRCLHNPNDLGLLVVTTKSYGPISEDTGFVQIHNRYDSPDSQEDSFFCIHNEPLVGEGSTFLQFEVSAKILNEPLTTLLLP